MAQPAPAAEAANNLAMPSKIATRFPALAIQKMVVYRSYLKYAKLIHGAETLLIPRLETVVLGHYLVRELIFNDDPARQDAR
jgi:hypothetical protein